MNTKKKKKNYWVIGIVTILIISFLVSIIINPQRTYMNIKCAMLFTSCNVMDNSQEFKIYKGESCWKYGKNTGEEETFMFHLYVENYNSSRDKIIQKAEIEGKKRTKFSIPYTSGVNRDKLIIIETNKTGTTFNIEFNIRDSIIEEICEKVEVEEIKIKEIETRMNQTILKNCCVNYVANQISFPDENFDLYGNLIEINITQRGTYRQVGDLGSCVTFNKNTSILSINLGDFEIKSSDCIGELYYEEEFIEKISKQDLTMEILEENCDCEFCETNTEYPIDPAFYKYCGRKAEVDEEGSFVDLTDLKCSKYRCGDSYFVEVTQ